MLDHNVFYREVGKEIKKRREERGLKQEELAAKVSLTRTSITNIEKGRQKLLLHTFVDIATSLGVDPVSLLPRVKRDKAVLEAMLQELSPEERNWIKATVESP